MAEPKQAKICAAVIRGTVGVGLDVGIGVAVGDAGAATVTVEPHPANSTRAIRLVRDNHGNRG